MLIIQTSQIQWFALFRVYLQAYSQILDLNPNVLILVNLVGLLLWVSCYPEENNSFEQLCINFTNDSRLRRLCSRDTSGS